MIVADAGRVWNHRHWRKRCEDILQVAHWMAESACIWLAAFSTHCLAYYGQKLGILASAVVVTVAIQIKPQMAAPTLVGALIGATSPILVPNFGWLALMSFIGCGVWKFFVYFNIGIGYSGRAGFVAFCTCHIVQLGVAMPAGAVAWTECGGAHVLWDTVLTWQKALVYLISPALSAMLSKACRDEGGGLENPIAGATVAMLLCFMVLSPVTWAYVADARVGVGIGGYVGMASATFLPNTIHFGLTGLLAGCWFIAWTPFCQRWGGKQGACAFLGFCLFRCIQMLFRRLLSSVMATLCEVVQLANTRKPEEPQDIKEAAALNIEPENRSPEKKIEPDMLMIISV